MYQDRLGNIPADYYWRDDIPAIELERVFRPSWLLVGFTDDLQNHNDFITAQIGTAQIVVQNFHGKLKAFRNVCTHRFSRIQTEKCGNRTLLCPYHGWSFGADGIPTGIPFNKQSFQLNDDDREALALESYALETCGRFVFVRMAKYGEGLKAFLGEYFGHLEHVTKICTDRFETLSFDWDANWKLGMDNAAEGYHVPLVHPESFGLVLKLDLDIAADKEHSLYRGNLTERSLKWWNGVKKSLKLATSDRFPEYGNFLIFPNIVITYSFGTFLTVQTFDPLAPNKLRINTSAWLGSNKGGAARDYVVEELKTFSKTVRDEDAAICAIAQSGISDWPHDRPPLLGEMEGRIAHFQKAYAKRMGLT